MKKSLLFLVLVFSYYGFSQVGIGTVVPNGSLDVTSANNGFLIPRIALTSTTVATVITPTVSELVYNTNTINDVVPGFYYWDGTKWVKFTLDTTIGNYWRLTGNAGTVAGTNFIGTTDNEQLVFKSNNIRYLTLTPAGHFVNERYLNTNAMGMDALGISFTEGFGYGADNEGFVGNFYNASTNAYSNVLLLKSASNSPNSTLLDISTGTINTVGTSVMNVKADGNVGIGTDAPGYKLDVTADIRVNGTVYASDVRYKNNIKNIENALPKLENIRGISYDYNQNYKDKRGFTDKHQLGVIAQEVEKIFPELVATDSEGYKAVDYAKFAPVFMKLLKN